MVSVALGALCLLAAILVEEGWVWLHITRQGLSEEERESRDQARHARSLSLVFLSLSAAAFGHAASVAHWMPFPWFLILGGLVTAAVGSWLVGASWRSPVTILGRSLASPILPVGGVLSRSLDWLARQSGPEEDESWGLECWESGGREGDAERAIATLREFRASVVEDVMMPREEVEGLAADWTVAQALEVIAKLGFSRYPVFDGSLDTIIGVLHVFDLVGASPSDSIRTYGRPPFMTTETKPITSLLRELQGSYNQMAVVVDEMGGTAGVVTVEDLLEELVGEIEDESDAPEALIKPLDPRTYWVDAAIRIEDLNERLKLEIPEGEYDTAAGLILERLERIPKIGERVVVGGVSFEVVAAEPHRVNGLRITLNGS